jgi:mono/diheme cytochrome c family protein
MRALLGLAAATLLLVAAAGHAAEVHAAETTQGAAKARMPEGEKVFQTYCQACHQANGQGLPGAFPPLAKSDYLLADPKRGIVAVLSGVS